MDVGISQKVPAAETHPELVQQQTDCASPQPGRLFYYPAHFH